MNCSEIRGPYKMFYQQSFSHNLVSFRRAYQCYCQPCKNGTFLLKRALFLTILKVGGGTCPQCLPPLPTPLYESYEAIKLRKPLRKHYPSSCCLGCRECCLPNCSPRQFTIIKFNKKLYKKYHNLSTCVRLDDRRSTN